MTPLVPLVMFGWIPFVLLLFATQPPRRAAIAAFVLAWLFLPVARYEMSGLPEYTKMSATCVGIVLGSLVFDSQRIAAFKPRLYDLPLIAWCLAPLLASLSNGLGLYDGVSAAINQTTTWGLPYLVGRLYLTDADALKEFAWALFLGGLIYIPLCLFEGRMSPQLHRMLYGFYAHPDFAQNIRFGGYRPMVFMEHGLMVGMWMASSSLVGVWLALARLLPGNPKKMRWALYILLLTTVNVRSMGALGLLLLGVVILTCSAHFKMRMLLAGLAIIPILYMGGRITGTFDGTALTDTFAAISKDRADSLQFRIDNETILLDKALVRPLFGWGGWGRARVYNELGEDISTTDGLWIITLGNYGVFGLASMTAVMLLPVWLFLRRSSPGQWRDASIAPMAALVTLLALYTVDNLLNAMVNPVFIVCAGGMTGYFAMRQDLEPQAQAKIAQAPMQAASIRFLGTASGPASKSDLRYLPEREAPANQERRRWM